MRQLLSATILAAALAVPIGGCGGSDDDKGAGTSPTPANTPAPSAPTSTPDSVTQLPPAFVQCMADRGFAVTSSDDIHAAPPDVLQTCFGALHEGGR